MVNTKIRDQHQLNGGDNADIFLITYPCQLIRLAEDIYSCRTCYHCFTVSHWGMEFQSEQLGVLVLPVILIAYLGVFFYLIYGFLSYSLLTYLVIGIAAYRTWESFLKIPRKIKPNVKEEYSVTIIGSGFAGKADTSLSVDREALYS